jgi:hypothetical protein
MVGSIPLNPTSNIYNTGIIYLHRVRADTPERSLTRLFELGLPLPEAKKYTRIITLDDVTSVLFLLVVGGYTYGSAQKRAPPQGVG